MASVLAGVTIVFALACCVAALLFRSSAALRHLVWTCAFAAVLLVPPLRWRLPQRAITPMVLPAIATTVTVTPRSELPGFDPATILPPVWALGTIIMTLRLLRNALRLRSIIGSAHGKLPILTSSRIRGPLVAGWFRPVILLPGTSVTWTASRRRAVFAHEAAHIRRHDPVILLAAQVATALYWFHPLCWLAVARLRAESERACDNAALRAGLLPSEYAGHLLDLARKFDIQLAIPMATTSHLESRVKSILDPNTNRSFPARLAWLAAAVLTALTLAPLTTLTLRAQQAAPGTATISGTVTDPTGARVPGATLTVTNSDVMWEETARSNEVGVYSFADIPGGHYTMEARVPGFAPFRFQNLALVNGGKLQVDPRLSVGSLSLAVTVLAQGTPKPQALVATGAVPRPIRVGGNVQAAKLIHKEDPVYPPDLRDQGVEAVVRLRAIISKDGVPQSLTVLNPSVNQEFVNAAIDALRQWRFTPALLNGEPIEVMTAADVSFSLKQ
jgi:TonB family protein